MYPGNETQQQTASKIIPFNINFPLSHVSPFLAAIGKIPTKIKQFEKFVTNGQETPGNGFGVQMQTTDTANQRSLVFIKNARNHGRHTGNIGGSQTCMEILHRTTEVN